jgi:hypothetical protein
MIMTPKAIPGEGHEQGVADRTETERLPAAGRPQPAEVAGNGNGQADDLSDLDQFDKDYDPEWPRRRLDRQMGLANAPGVDTRRFLREEVYPRLTAEAIFTHPKHKFHKSGDKWRGDCPRHDSKSGTSFTVTASSKLWWCGGCQVGGAPLEYLSWLRTGQILPPDEEFIDLARQLATMAGVPFPERELTEEEREARRRQEARRAILQTVAQHAQGILWSSAGESARRYLQTRGFTDDDIRALGLGLILNAYEVRRAVEAAGHDMAIADEAGVCRPIMVDYIIFPWLDECGRPLTLYGTYKDKEPPRGKPKKMALPGEGTKGSPLYLDKARQAGHDHLVLAEGLLDAALAQVRGDTRVVSPVGNKVSFEQAKTMARRGIRAVTICLDPDKGGREGTRSCVKVLEQEGIVSYVAPQLPDRLDPDDFIKRDGIDAWRRHVGEAVHAYRWTAVQIIEKHKPPEGWTDATQDAAINEAVTFAAGRSPDRDDWLCRYFWPEMVQSTEADLEALKLRVREARSGSRSSSGTMPEPQQEFDSRTIGNDLARNESGRGPRFPEPVPASALTTVDLERDWILPGYIAPGAITQLSALWKAGKTTILGHLLRQTGQGGPLCGLEVAPCKVLVLSEEPDGLWASRRDALGIGDNVHFLVRPLAAKPTPAVWLKFIAHLKRLVRERSYNLVIFDTISSFWPVVNENDAGEVQAALMPLRQLTDLRAAVVLVHHLRKGDGPEGTASRGSGAIGAFVDIILELRRFSPQDRKDRRRVLTGYSRYQLTPAELVVELSGDGLSYTPCGDRQQASREERLNTIDTILPADGEGLTVDEVRDAWPEDNKPGKRTVTDDLKCGAEGSRWTVAGTGKKGDPFRYRRG